MKKDACSRRDFLKVGAVAGLSVAAMGTLAGCSSASEEELPPVEQEPEEEPAAESPAAEQPETDTIYIVDVIHCKPATGKEIFDHYMADYVPDAKNRGMTLVASNVNPPIWLTDDVSNNTLEFVWSVPGMMGWAAMVGVSRYDPEMSQKLIDFWYDMDDSVISRTRTLSAPDTDVESLTTLARLNPQG